MHLRQAFEPGNRFYHFDRVPTELAHGFWMQGIKGTSFVFTLCLSRKQYLVIVPKTVSAVLALKQHHARREAYAYAPCFKGSRHIVVPMLVLDIHAAYWWMSTPITEASANLH